MKFEDQEYYNCRITLEDNTTYNVAANWLHNQGLDYWKGWNCDTGKIRVFIDKDFNVYSGECKNDVLGNLLTNWYLNSDPTVCKQERCSGCTDDLIIGKTK